MVTRHTNHWLMDSGAVHRALAEPASDHSAGCQALTAELGPSDSSQTPVTLFDTTSKPLYSVDCNALLSASNKGSCFLAIEGFACQGSI